jgi:hypothetical protein
VGEYPATDQEEGLDRAATPDDHLHASLALLPVDASQVDYLFNRLKKATHNELPVLRDALKAHRSSLTPKLWTVLESAKPGDVSLERSHRRQRHSVRSLLALLSAEYAESVADHQAG